MLAQKSSHYGTPPTNVIDGDHKFGIGDIVLIAYRNKIDSEKGENRTDLKNFYMGQKESDDCLALIAWLYQPTHLVEAAGLNAKGEREKASSGEKAYHGKHEVITSNHLAIVSIPTFEKVFNKDIERLDETQDNICMKQYYYRQSFDFTTKTLFVSFTHLRLV